MSTTIYLVIAAAVLVFVVIFQIALSYALPQCAVLIDDLIHFGSLKDSFLPLESARLNLQRSRETKQSTTSLYHKP